MEKRINYIDCIKGFTVLWIVWIHTEQPTFVSAPVRVTLFYFLSGIFFKDYLLHVFLNKKVQGLIVPFVFAYLISYFYRIGLHYWDYKEITSFNYLCIFDVFRWEIRSDYLFVNIPLYFLLALFNMQLLLLFIIKISKKNKDPQKIFILLSLLVLCLGIVLELFPIPLPFMLNKTFTFFIYYFGGFLLGKKLIQFITEQKKEVFLALISLLIFGIISLSPLKEIVSDTVYMFLATLFFIPIIFIVFQHLSRLKIFRFFPFFGKNSLTVLAFHVPVQIILDECYSSYMVEKRILLPE